VCGKVKKKFIHGFHGFKLFLWQVAKTQRSISDAINRILDWPKRKQRSTENGKDTVSTVRNGTSNTITFGSA
jgi:hypothetical protein